MWITVYKYAEEQINYKILKKLVDEILAALNSNPLKIFCKPFISF